MYESYLSKFFFHIEVDLIVSTEKKDGGTWPEELYRHPGFKQH